MQLTEDSEIIESCRQERHRPVFEYPDALCADGFGIDVTRAHTIQRPIRLQGMASFENRPVQIEMRPTKDGTPRIGIDETTLPLAVEHLVSGEHNIQLGSVKIIEHPLAVMVGLGVDFDLNLDEASFPTFDRCCLPFVDGIRENIVDCGSRSLITVDRALMLRFERGYLLLEPDTGARDLILDHQIQYPGRAVGTQRIRFALTPERFAFLCQARTPSFRSAEETRGMLETIRSGCAPYPITEENVLFADEDRLHNPRPEFVWKGHNYEFLFHEVIDIIAWLKFVEVLHAARFVGTMTTFLFGHPEQIEAAKFFCSDPQMAKRLIRLD
jgi:UDP-3-O-acyl-N-acetylglucosamine deacetylase